MSSNPKLRRLGFSKVRASPKQIAVASVLIFFVALGVRLLSWHDTQLEAAKVQSGVVADYQRTAHLLRQFGFRGFISSDGPLADPNLLGHPPGYPILLAFTSESNSAIRFFQITCDAIAAVVVFLIALELVSLAPALVAGLLVALSPQFSWNSVLLLPDTLAVLPLLVALYCLIHALRKPRLVTFVVAGALIGLSCWLRANALLLAPFVAAVVMHLLPRGQRLRYASVFLLGAVITVGSLTLRNWIVFHHFIPVSLGAGQTLLEGIADYDPEKRFGIPDTDMGIMKMEAVQYNRPDYYSTLFAPDGVKRERMRLARGFSVVRDNPGWFASVMVRRAGSMVRLERARIIAPGPPVTHDLAGANRNAAVWMSTPAELLAKSEKTSGIAASLSPDSQTLKLTTDTSKYGTQLKMSPVVVTPYHDYVLRWPVKVEQGRVIVKVNGATSQNSYGSAILEKSEVKDPSTQPTVNLELPFVSSSEATIRIEFENGAPADGHSIIHFGSAELYSLGPASFLWTRYPRFIIRGVQRLFITAVMLPLALMGLFFLIRAGAREALVLLLIVPAYYLCVQSALHTEYRYVLAVHYFLFVLVAVALSGLTSILLGFVRNQRRIGSG